MPDLKCPKCGQNHLRSHTTLVNSEDGQFMDVHYEWECSWCGYTEGDYKSTAEARQDYENKYGGSKNG